MAVLSKGVKLFLLFFIIVIIFILARIVGYRSALPPWECSECPGSRPLDKAHIPKHIHQVFFFITDKELPKKYYDAQNTWRGKNPGFRYTLWNTSMVDELIKSKYPELETLYNSYDHWVKRADMARYLILHQFGGIYADMDIRCRKSMSHLNDTLKFKTSVVIRLTDPWGPSNDFIFATPKHPFLDHVLKGLPAANRWYVLPYATTIFSTGPMFFWGRLQNYPFQDEIHIVKNVSEYLDLMHGSSWHSWDGVMIWWIFNTHILRYMLVVGLALALSLYCLCRHKRNLTNNI